MDKRKVSAYRTRHRTNKGDEQAFHHQSCNSNRQAHKQNDGWRHRYDLPYGDAAKGYRTYIDSPQNKHRYSEYTPHVANGTADDGVGNRPRTVEIVLVYATYQRHQYPKQMPTAAAFALWYVRYEQPNNE